MALESSLWQRCKTGIKTLAWQGHKLDVQRVENAATSGHPDIEGCIDGSQLWIELKSCARPVRRDTPIRPKKRQSQEIWHAARTKAGGRQHWILIQVGDDHDARLYLIPGCLYEKTTAVESVLAGMSVVSPRSTTADCLLRASKGW